AVENQVAIIYAVINNYLKDIPLEKVSAYEKDLYKYLEETHPDIPASIREEKVLTPETEEKLKKALEEFSRNYV
ncbi:MAG: F0F1 ATP synthase subunit alpha, partial [Ruminiclostridium sp.]|nr:F0F1 ATP synthase subunit alpha [Ruminiclostridium sp.]